MSSDHTGFDKLQRLLALKRHEQPPPRFFNDFSDRVLGRLHIAAPAEPMSWWQRLGLELDLKPAFVCAWGIVLCGILLTGIISSLQLGANDGRRALLVPGPQVDSLDPLASPLVAAGVSVDRPRPGFSGSINPVLATHSSPALLNHFTLMAHPAGFSIGLEN